MVFLDSSPPASLVLTITFTQHFPLLEGRTQSRRRQDEASRRMTRWSILVAGLVQVDPVIAEAVLVVFVVICVVSVITYSCGTGLDYFILVLAIFFMFTLFVIVLIVAAAV